jgi:hypothetical protein
MKPGSGSLLTHRWREPDSNFRFPNRFARIFEKAVPPPMIGFTVSRPGTEGSNPSPSCGESDANLTNTRRNGDRQAGRGYRSKAAKTALSPFICLPSGESGTSTGVVMPASRHC